MSIKRIIIDIRTPEEILNKRLISYSESTLLLFIPVSHIKFNVESLIKLSKRIPIYIICKKAKRSTMIKNKFFANHPNIISINGGINQLENLSKKLKDLKVLIYRVHILKNSSDTGSTITESKLIPNNNYYMLLIIIIIYIISQLS